MFSRDLTIAKFDADLFAAMEQEAVRQEEHIELIASENYTSPAVMEAQGSVLTNKYAEGYPGKEQNSISCGGNRLHAHSGETSSYRGREA